MARTGARPPPDRPAALARATIPVHRATPTTAARRGRLKGPHAGRSSRSGRGTDRAEAGDAAPQRFAPRHTGLARRVVSRSSSRVASRVLSRCEGPGRPSAAVGGPCRDGAVRPSAWSPVAAAARGGRGVHWLGRQAGPGVGVPPRRQGPTRVRRGPPSWPRSCGVGHVTRLARIDDRHRPPVAANAATTARWSPPVASGPSGGRTACQPCDQGSHPDVIVGDGPPFVGESQGAIALSVGDSIPPHHGVADLPLLTGPALPDPGCRAPGHGSGAHRRGRDDPRSAPVSVDHGCIGLSRPGHGVRGMLSPLLVVTTLEAVRCTPL